jgi:hypothetical protein
LQQKDAAIRLGQADFLRHGGGRKAEQ